MNFNSQTWGLSRWNPYKIELIQLIPSFCSLLALSPLSKTNFHCLEMLKCRERNAHATLIEKLFFFLDSCRNFALSFWQRRMSFFLYSTVWAFDRAHVHDCNIHFELLLQLDHTTHNLSSPPKNYIPLPIAAPTQMLAQHSASTSEDEQREENSARIKWCEKREQNSDALHECVFVAHANWCFASLFFLRSTVFFTSSCWSIFPTSFTAFK